MWSSRWKVDELETLLRLSGYPHSELDFMVNGFRNGFDIGYEGPQVWQSSARNLPFTVGDKLDLWNKLMFEVEAKRVVGPFLTVPYANYIQSPIGLVPKDGGHKTRLIFHLSYQFSETEKSLNYHTPKEKCSVKYNDLDKAVRLCLKLVQEMGSTRQPLYFAKTDFQSAFRVLGLNPSSWKWLIMYAKHPETGVKYFFVDKCLPFGVSISCSHFQQVSEQSNMYYNFLQRKKDFVNNYLDDFLFLARTLLECNRLVRLFLELCERINFPVSHEKTQWAAIVIVFLGMEFWMVSHWSFLCLWRNASGLKV